MSKAFWFSVRLLGGLSMVDFWVDLMENSTLLKGRSLFPVFLKPVKVLIEIHVIGILAIRSGFLATLILYFLTLGGSLAWTKCDIIVRFVLKIQK